MKLLSPQLSRHDWLLWTPLDRLFVDAATFTAGTSKERALSSLCRRMSVVTVARAR